MYLWPDGKYRTTAPPQTSSGQTSSGLTGPAPGATGPAAPAVGATGNPAAPLPINTNDPNVPTGGGVQMTLGPDGKYHAYASNSFSGYGGTGATGQSLPVGPGIPAGATGATAAAGPTGASGPYGSAGVADNGAHYQGVDSQELVGNQLEGLLSQRGDYIQQAIAQSEAQAAGRGLLNSSMAAGAGENAAIASALPIAQNQAQQYSNVAMANQQAYNQQLGAKTAAEAQVASANASAGGQIGAAGLYADATKQGQQLQYQMQGQQLGFNYAQLGQQGSQFNASLDQQGNQFNAQMGQNNSQFNAQLSQNNQQFGASLNNQQNEFQQSQSFAQGQFMANMDWNKYALGSQLQMQSQNEYANMFGAIMQNPNMTATDRKAALSNAHDFYAGQAQQNATIPAFTPPWISDPNYWATNWSHP